MLQDKPDEKPKQLFTEKQLDTLASIPSFVSATKYASQEKFELAEIQFEETLQILEKQMEKNEIVNVDVQIALIKKFIVLLKI